MPERFFNIFEYESSSLDDNCIIYHDVTFINDVTQIKAGTKFSQCAFQVASGRLVVSDGRTVNLEYYQEFLRERNRCDKCGGPVELQSNLKQSFCIDSLSNNPGKAYNREWMSIPHWWEYEWCHKCESISESDKKEVMVKLRQNLKRCKIAENILGICERGHYHTHGGQHVKLEINKSPDVVAHKGFDYKPLLHTPQLSVNNETTQNAIFRLHEKYPEASIVALNFASAKRPGGGFLEGSMAQEEDLCYSSTLYASLRNASSFYEMNAESRLICGHPYNAGLYENVLAISRNVAFIKNNAYGVFTRPTYVDVVTCAAPNANEFFRLYERADKDGQSILEEVLDKRIRFMLHEIGPRYDILILGAWGCGVFGNDPHFVARLFKQNLQMDFCEKVKLAHFPVYDREPGSKTFNTFKKVLQYV